MAKTTKKRPKTTKKKDKSKYFFVSVLSLFFVLSILLIALLKKNQILYYYALYFHKYEHKTLKNTAQEEKRIDKIIHLYSNKTFGMDISHYQRREDILWDSLTIAKGAIPRTIILTISGRKPSSTALQEGLTISTAPMKTLYFKRGLI